jgi:hypothetical protein
MKRKKTHILSVENNDTQKEIEFEIAFQLSLTVEQRYKRMKKLHSKTMEFVKKNDYPKTPFIVSRA